jgi:hypothetical protein
VAYFDVGSHELQDQHQIAVLSLSFCQCHYQASCLGTSCVTAILADGSLVPFSKGQCHCQCISQLSDSFECQAPHATTSQHAVCGFAFNKLCPVSTLTGDAELQGGPAGCRRLVRPRGAVALCMHVGPQGLQSSPAHGGRLTQGHAADQVSECMLNFTLNHRFCPCLSPFRMQANVDPACLHSQQSASTAAALL